MIKGKAAETSLVEHRNLLYISQRFWLCNILGWLTFNLAEGIRNSFDGSPLVDNILNYLPTSVLGLLGGLLVRLSYEKYGWHRRHPLCLIPVAGWIAVIFGLVNTALNYSDLVFSIPEVCSRDYQRPPHSCGKLSDLFLESMGGMLIWCLFYFLIQAERKTDEKVSYDSVALCKALFCILFLSYLGTHLSVIAWMDWGDTYHLYSRTYFIYVLSLFLPIFSTTYILFIKSELQLWGSRTATLIPILFIVTFCCVTFNLGVGGIIFRLDHLPDNWTFRYILFGEIYGNFSHPNYLAGALDGGFVDTLSMTLFYLSCRYTPRKRAEIEPFTTRANFKKVFISWSYYFLFWLFFGLLIYATDIMDWAFFGQSVPTTNAISFTLAGVFIGAVLRLQMLHFATKQISIVILAIKIASASIFAGILLSSTIWLMSYTYIFVVLNGYEIEKFSSFVAMDNAVLANMLSTCILCGLWSFICYMIESMRLLRESTIKQLQLEKSMKDVQLNALAGKVDPHFIFNALNNIRALVNEDGEKARSAIAVLSDILRSPIATNSQDKISIKEELLLIRNYVSLSKIQLEDRLEYKEDVNESAHFALIPSMMLQILVENAIKHGISQLPDGGVLFIKITRREQELICEVNNHGNLHNSRNTAGFGIGINAVRDRLALLYTGSASFSLQELNDTVVAKLILPFESSI